MLFWGHKTDESERKKGIRTTWKEDRKKEERKERRRVEGREGERNQVCVDPEIVKRVL